jgi:hypothetical protein
MRWVMITMAVMLHTGIAVVMGLRTFSLIMLIMLMAFVPEETVQALVKRLGRGVSRFRLGINDHLRGQVRAASLIRSFDAWDQVHILDHASARKLPQGQETGASAKALSPAHIRLDITPSGGERLELVTSEGEILTGYELFERLTRSVRPLWPFAVVTWIPGVASLVRRWFSRQAHEPGKIAKRESQRQKEPVAK